MSDSCPTHPHTDGAMVFNDGRDKDAADDEAVDDALDASEADDDEEGRREPRPRSLAGPAGFGSCRGRCNGAAISLRRGSAIFFVRVRCITDSSDNLSKSRILCSLLGSLPRVLHLTEGVWTICVGCTSLLLRSNASSGLFARIG